MKQKTLTYTFYYWGAFCRGAFVLDPNFLNYLLIFYKVQIFTNYM